ncbi:hypothetical protein [Flavimaricola marinus]|uniref:50S ribosomal protein L35 n=1 Tax=Flavimaricola marinus TaxID=1819565 RepID=A0A238LAX8_9RHOB|nr:hypothetical protein [Flavimaricola marinus]SMY06788.1 hypothetical protein LOM8899_00918 [Flavimaricola marinus]
MNADLFLVVGIVVVAFTIPAIVGAFSEGRAPRAAAIMVMIGGGLIALAVYQTPGGYQVSEIPSVFARVIGYYIN